MEKRCKECRKLLSLEKFSKNKKSKDGFNYYCKVCFNIKFNKSNKKYQQNYRLEHKKLEKVFVKKLDYFNDIRISLSPKLSKDEKNRLKTLKRRAWDRIMTKLRNGSLKGLNHCLVCEKKDKKLYKHHEDYGNPYDILWLCAKCHGELHSIKRRYYERGIKVSFEIANKINVKNTEDSQLRNKIEEYYNKRSNRAVFKKKEKEIKKIIYEATKEKIKKISVNIPKNIYNKIAKKRFDDKIDKFSDAIIKIFKEYFSKKL